MNDHLYNLLQDAERTAPAPARAGDLIARVYRRRRRRRAVRGGAVLGILLAIAVTPLWLQEHLSAPPQLANQASPTSQANIVEPMQLELTSLTHTIKRHASIADLLVAGERDRALSRARLQLARSRPDVLQINRERAETAAITLLRNADRMSAHPQRAQQAIEAYERMIQLFPDTSAAAVAQQRLRQLKM